SPFWCGLSGAPGCVTWELILDGYSESSYSATPRFAAARLPWFTAVTILLSSKLLYIIMGNLNVLSPV
ncbi:hypothetical protein NMV77_24400, partial [Escherichia coli]|uniref:hypothetical protein n=1 Tax=Escherichia coli TaxID=562 RepID=UPI002247D809